MVVTVLRTTYLKTGPTIVNCRDYKIFSEQTLKQDLRAKLESIQAADVEYNHFQNCFQKIIDKHAPMKKKWARANDGPS